MIHDFGRAFDTEETRDSQVGLLLLIRQVKTSMDSPFPPFICYFIFFFFFVSSLLAARACLRVGGAKPFGPVRPASGVPDTKKLLAAGYLRRLDFINN